MLVEPIIINERLLKCEAFQKKIIRHKTLKLIEQDEYSFNNDCGCADRTRWF